MIKNKLKINFSTSDYEVTEFDNQTHFRIKVRPMYFELGFSPSPQIFGRYAILARLPTVLNLLPSKYGLLIWDVYRPRAVQARLFEWMKKELRIKSPQSSDENITAETKKYMSPPSKIGDEYCPPHLSGGAIDLTLYDTSSGKELEMGTPFDDCTVCAHRDYFDLKTTLSPQEREIKENRHLLRTAMENAGFTSYKYEWWHFDLGDMFWSHVTGHASVFGPLFGDEEWPNPLLLFNSDH